MVLLMKRKKLSEMSDIERFNQATMESVWNNPRDEAASKFYIERYLKKRKGKKRKTGKSRKKE